MIAEIDLTAAVSITLVNYHEREQEERVQKRRKRHEELARVLRGGRAMAWTGGFILTTEIFIARQERPSLLVAGFGLLSLGLPPMAPK